MNHKQIAPIGIGKKDDSLNCSIKNGRPNLHNYERWDTKG